MLYYFAVVSLLVGLVVGSFLNVVIYRLPNHESIIRPGSHCPKCGKAIRWYHNVPVGGWLMLKGKCLDCGERISIRYPLVEGLAGLAFLAAFIVFGVGWHTLVVWVFVAVLIAVGFIDYDHQEIPVKITLPAAAILLCASIALTPEAWWKYLIATFGAAAFLFIIVIAWPGGMGMGDVYLALLMGAVLGVSVTIALFAAFLIGAVSGIMLMVLKGYGRKTKIPFGPFLAIGSVVAVFAGEAILHSYLTLYS